MVGRDCDIYVNQNDICLMCRMVNKDSIYVPSESSLVPTVP